MALEEIALKIDRGPVGEGGSGARRGPGPPQENCSAGVCGNGNYLIYEYTGTQIEGSTTFSADSEVGFAAWPLKPGRYEVRLLLDDGYRSVATSAPFRVTSR
jgi:hypothetical protein